MYVCVTGFFDHFLDALIHLWYTMDIISILPPWVYFMF